MRLASGSAAGGGTVGYSGLHWGTVGRQVGRWAVEQLLCPVAVNELVIQ